MSRLRKKYLLMIQEMIMILLLAPYLTILIFPIKNLVLQLDARNVLRLPEFYILDRLHMARNLCATNTPENSTGSQKKSADFVSPYTAKSHEHMVRVLRTLSANADNEGPDEPATFEEARSKHDWLEWKKAMESGYNSLIENGTWEVVSPLTEANIITGRWVFKPKKDRFGNILKYNARWVAHGYKQKEGLDYVHTFAAVINPMSYL